MQITVQQSRGLARDGFSRRLIAIIRRHHPRHAQGVSDAAFAAAFGPLVERAARHGLRDERGCAIFAYGAWLFGERFDERVPGVAQILGAVTLTSAQKADALADFTRTTMRLLTARPS